MKMQTALITGASSGIGYELAKLCAEDGMELVLVAREQDKLTKVAGELAQKFKVTTHVITKDLTEPKAPQQIFDELAKKSMHVDILINNAGFGAGGEFTNIGYQTQLDMIEVNVTALTALTHLFLPPMVKRNHGRIL